jgi:hypothetical protein
MIRTERSASAMSSGVGRDTSRARIAPPTPTFDGPAPTRSPTGSSPPPRSFTLTP